MTRTITTKRTECTKYQTIEEVYTYEEIEEMFNDDPNCLVMQLLKKLKQVETHCAIRETALYKIRSLVAPGSEISKVAGEALCYGNYTKK